MPLVFKIQDPLYTIMNVRNSSVLKIRASWKRFNHPLQSVPTSFKAGPLYEVGGAAVGAVGRRARRQWQRRRWRQHLYLRGREGIPLLAFDFTHRGLVS